MVACPPNSLLLPSLSKSANTASCRETNIMADRPKIAGIVTEYRKYSHAQHICDRFLEGYGWNLSLIHI